VAVISRTPSKEVKVQERKEGLFIIFVSKVIEV
jgi:hypothetical protein